MPAFGAAFPSEEHFGRPGSAVLHLPETLRSVYVASEPLPAGSELGLIWTPRDSDEAWVLWMTKSDAGFRYALERPDGSGATPAELTRCARCHAEAASDELFHVLPANAEGAASAK